MKIFRGIVSAAATLSAVLLGSGLLAAAPAHAASITLSDAVCNGTAPNNVITRANVSASTGDVVTITGNFSTCRELRVSNRLVTSPSDIVAAGNGVGTPTLSGSFYVLTTANTFTSIQITFTNTTSTNFGGFGLGSSTYDTQRTLWGVTYTGSGGGSSPDSASSSVPASIVQQFGKPAAGTCDAIAPESLNWAGVTNGGWGESWAQWMNNGNGGAVCTRTLVYSTAQGRWVVG